jgi:enamine deaminase RidA (YjgF/YER057c/UK114 family)
MPKASHPTEVCTTDAPAPVGPYSQAIRANGLVFVSGQIPLDPKTGEKVGGEIEDEARQVLANLSAVLEPAPARVTVGVAALPLGAQVEIDAIGLTDA